jgi:hypothetical protein
MRRPLVLPEILVVPLVIFPVCAHIGEKVGSPSSGQNGSDVGIYASFVTIRIEGAIAVVGPGEKSALRSRAV